MSAAAPAPAAAPAAAAAAPAAAAAAPKPAAAPVAAPAPAAAAPKPVAAPAAPAAAAPKPVAAPVAAPKPAAPAQQPVVKGVKTANTGCCGGSSGAANSSTSAKKSGPVTASNPKQMAANKAGVSPAVASGLYIVSDSASTLMTYLQAVISDVAIRRGVVHVAVSGGSIVPLLAQALKLAFEARINLHTEKWMVWYVDERHVPHSSPESNHRQMTEMVYSSPAWKRGGSSKQVQAVNTSLPLADSAAEYEERLIREFAAHRPGSVPRFDVVLLGMGEDGHTASLFPGSPLLALDITRDPIKAEAEAKALAAATGRPSSVRVKLVVPVADAPKAPSARVSFTLSLINSANNVGLFANGSAKALAAANALEQVSSRFSARNKGTPMPLNQVDTQLPAARIAVLDGSWPAAYFLDAEAASKIAPPEAPKPVVVPAPAPAPVPPRGPSGKWVYVEEDAPAAAAPGGAAPATVGAPAAAAGAGAGGAAYDKKNVV